MIYDFHTHTFLSDGELSPVELIRRAVVCGYGAIGLTDHVGLGGLEQVIEATIRDCALAAAHWDIVALPGVELTHLPPETISDTARRAKELGARLVVVHGETIIEPVPPGTNLAAVTSPYVDLLAHPGLLSREEAHQAAQNGVFLELTRRQGHCLTNGHVARLALREGASLLLSSDAHSPQDLLLTPLARKIVEGAGLSHDQVEYILAASPRAFLQKVTNGNNYRLEGRQV